MDFLWHKIDEKEKEEIKNQAKLIMDNFSSTLKGTSKLSKVGKVGESLIERDYGEREEGVKAPLGVPQIAECGGNIDKKIMFDNAPEKHGDFIVAEKKIMVKIRKARKGDLKKIAEIFMNEFSKPPFNRKWNEKTALKKITDYNKICLIYVAEINNKIIGFIIANTYQGENGLKVQINQIAVSHKFQKRGIGKKLIKKIEDFYNNKGIKKLDLRTNKKSIAFKVYKKLGYKQDKNLVFMEKKTKMTTLEKLKNYLQEIKKNDKSGKKINAFLQLNSDALKEAEIIDGKIKNGKAGKLAGKIIAVKANINVKGLNASCGSKVLENYKAPYDASVIKRIKEEDGLIIGVTNMDEFACGWSGETSAFGPTRNPIDLKLVAGGSSSGSAACVSAGFCDMALGSDTGGSIRVPSSHCAVVGIKPTYSSVSRYGLIDMAMSFDQIGPIAKNVFDASLLLSIIHGKDENDSISQFPPAHLNRGKINLSEIDNIPKNLVVGVLDFPVSNKNIQKLIDEKIEKVCEKYNWKIKKVKIPYLDLAIATYYPIVYVEFFSATRKFDGRRYGKKIEDACGPEVLRRILGGGEITKAEHKGRYYYQALKVRKLLQEEFAKVFKNVDCIISPTVPRLPHKIGEKISSKEMFEYDALTCPINIVGNCALSLPVGDIDGIPVGMQISCDKFEDEKMLRIARSVEKVE